VNESQQHLIRLARLLFQWRAIKRMDTTSSSVSSRHGGTVVPQRRHQRAHRYRKQNKNYRALPENTHRGTPARHIPTPPGEEDMPDTWPCVIIPTVKDNASNRTATTLRRGVASSRVRLAIPDGATWHPPASASPASPRTPPRVPRHLPRRPITSPGGTPRHTTLAPAPTTATTPVANSTLPDY